MLFSHLFAPRIFLIFQWHLPCQTRSSCRVLSRSFLVGSGKGWKSIVRVACRELGVPTISVIQAKSAIDEWGPPFQTMIAQKTKEQRTCVRCSVACTLPQVLRQTVAYWLSGLNVRMPASVVEQTPAGSTRTTASSSAQKPRRPVWLIVIGTAFTV